MDGGVELSVAADVLVTSTEECAECKRQFLSRYTEYQQLDEQLASNTSDFESLEAEYTEAEGQATQAAVAARLQSLWQARQPDVHRKVEAYRRLHVELRRLKAAVNHYVDGLSPTEAV